MQTLPHAMEVACTWPEVITSITPWVPLSRLPRWGKSKAIYFSCEAVEDGRCVGHVVDPQLPLLGQHVGTRTFRVTDQPVAFSFQGGPRITAGHMYVAFGTAVPIWNFEASRWELPLPNQTKSSGCARLLGLSCPRGDFRMAELCCGYMGGWSAAAKVMPQWKVNVALDISEQATATYKLNHGGNVLKDMGSLENVDTSQCLILCHDLRDFDWLEVFNVTDVNVFSLSTPCQSWSSLSSGSGSDSANGQVLVAATQAVRLLQPALVLVEQVYGFRQHTEYDDFIQAMQQSGYRLAQAGVHNLEVLTHTSRKRWLGIFVNTAHVQHWDQLGRFLNPIVREVHVFRPDIHCLPFMTEEQFDQVRIGHADALLLDDPKYLPPWKRDSVSSKCSALPSRVVRSGGVFPTITAAYRKAPSFSKDLLESKGLMSWLVMDNHGKTRWCSKFEAAFALGFCQGTAIPKGESEGFLAVGNSISPYHAGLVMSHAVDVMVAQRGEGERSDFREVLSGLRDLRGNISEDVIQELGPSHETLGSRLPQTGLQIRCPHCRDWTNQPLVQACKECAIIACVACITDECLPSHYGPGLSSGMSSVNAAPEGRQQFHMVHAQSGAVVTMHVNPKMTIGFFVAQHRLPASVRFFVRDVEVNDAYVPQHNDEVWQVDMPHWENKCPMCLADKASWTLRFCSHCKSVGCNLCVADVCGRCTGGKRVCNPCHQSLAEAHYRTFQEAVEQQQLSEADRSVGTWEQIRQCGIEAQWQHIRVLMIPFGRTTVQRGVYADKRAIIHRLESVGYLPAQPCTFYWGMSTTPCLQSAIQDYIVVCPSDRLEEGLPVVCRSEEGETLKLCPKELNGGAFKSKFLSRFEVENGYYILIRNEIVEDHDKVSVQAGMVVQKLAPWRMNPPQAARTDKPHDPASVRNAIAYSIRQQAARLPSTNVSGYIDLNGKIKFMPKPKPGMCWPEWLAGERLPPVADMWATEDGRYLPATNQLSGQPIIIRLHYRLRGGTKSTAKNDAILQKLSAHLEQKGVPPEASEQRATKVANAVGFPALEAVYQSLDPWRSLKQAAQDKVRLVMPEELREAKGKPRKPKDDTRGTDPWEKDDPWKQAAKPTAPEAEIVHLSLVPGFFVDEDDVAVNLLQHVSAQSTGVALLDAGEVETIAASERLLSDDPLAGIVVGVHKPLVGKLQCDAITFPAMHGEQKVLLRGFLVNFGSRSVKPQSAKHSIDLQIQDVSVVAIEIRREFTGQWEQICLNPLKHAFNAIDGLQKATISTWAKRYFAGRKPSTPADATTWHGFLKVPTSNLEALLMSSGKQAVFLTPKQDGDDMPSGAFRIIWLDSLNMEQAISIHRVHQGLLGIVRGRSTLGVRVRASEYGLVRKMIDPSWSSDGVLTDIVVSRRWKLAPLPPQADKRFIQDVLTKLGWKAVPLKQISAQAWIIGAACADAPPTDNFQLAGKPVLITEQLARKQATAQEVVVAGSSPLRKSFNKAARAVPAATSVPAISGDMQCSQSQTKGPTGALMCEMKESLNGRLQDLQEQLQAAVNTVNHRVTAIETHVNNSVKEVHTAVMGQDSRIQQLEANFNGLSNTVVTKTDLAQALREAFDSQTRDIRSMLAKRSPDATPTNDTNKVSRVG